MSNKNVGPKAKPAPEPVKAVTAAPEPKPEPSQYPKMLYRHDIANRTVQSADEEAEAVKEGWKDHQ